MRKPKSRTAKNEKVTRISPKNDRTWTPEEENNEFSLRAMMDPYWSWRVARTL